ncbi:MAG: Holliday junction resolvase RuvX [Candidatus Cloacimonadaceae bacterium]
MSRILAIDHGSKRIGIALSDPMRIFAKPFATLPNTGFKKFITALKQIISEQDVTLIVLGMPWAIDGSKTPKTLEVETFGEKLRKHLDTEIVFWDERYSSSEADEALKTIGLSWEEGKTARDAMAATMILKSYLENHEGS